MIKSSTDKHLGEIQGAFFMSCGREKENLMERMPILSDSDMSLFELKTRYVRNYLTFAGKNSKDFLLYISGPGVYDSPAVDVELQTISGKNGDLIRDNAKAGEHRFKNLGITYDAFFFDGPRRGRLP